MGRWAMRTVGNTPQTQHSCAVSYSFGKLDHGERCASVANSYELHTRMAKIRLQAVARKPCYYVWSGYAADCIVAKRSILKRCPRCEDQKNLERLIAGGEPTDAPPLDR